jgi:simple sugar transport system substrate-binding protein/basic membrane protein A
MVVPDAKGARADHNIKTSSQFYERTKVEMYKKLVTISFLLLLVISLVACSGAPAEEPAAEEPAAEEPVAEEPAAEEPAAEEAAPAEEPFKFALVLPGPMMDKSWNESAVLAVQKLAEKDNVEVAISESVTDADIARVLRQYSDEGYDFVWAHSFGFQDATFEVAKEYPDVNYAWGGGIGRAEGNVADYEQPFYEPAYLIGIIAGYVSETGKLGALYGFDIPACHSMGEALVAGARLVNPDATVAHAAIGDWYDVAKGKEAALAQADTGVDFWIGCGNSGAEGAIEAAKEVGGYTVSYLGDMFDLGPDVVMVNLIWDLEPLATQMMLDTQNGTFDGPYYQFGLPEGTFRLEYNPNLIDKIPQEAFDKIDEITAQIDAGEFEVPFIGE